MVRMVSEVIKCIVCGELNNVEEAKQTLEYEGKEDWTINSTKTVRRKFKEMCGRKGVNFNEGLLYLLGLDVKEQWGKNAQNVEASFGIPGTSTK
jgi:hypothetical protein